MRQRAPRRLKTEVSETKVSRLIRGGAGLLSASLLTWGVLTTVECLEVTSAQAQPSVPVSRRGGKASKTRRMRGQVVELKLTLERTPNDEATLIKLSKLLIRLRELPEALTYLRVASRVNAKSTQTRYLIAYTLRGLKRYREAVEAYEGFLAIAPPTQKSNGLFGLAKTLELLGDTSRAVETYQEFVALEKRPERRRWVSEAQKSIRLLQASRVALIDVNKNSDEPADIEEKPAKERRVDQKVPLIAESSARSAQPKSPPPDQDATTTSAAQPTSTQTSQAQPTAQRSPLKPLNLELERADKLFAAQKYKEATEAYQALASRELPAKLGAQMRYFSAVSAYLGAQFEVAQRESELGLLLEPTSSRLRGLAVLSFIQRNEQSERASERYQTAFAQIRLALREGRFHNSLELIERVVEAAQGRSQGDKRAAKSARAVLSDPLLLHAKGRALLGLKRYQEAYDTLTQAAKGLRHPHLTLDLALTAQRLGAPKAARRHFQELRAQTAPQEGSSSSLLYLLAGEGTQAQ